jgi:hypothetical protein
MRKLRTSGSVGGADRGGLLPVSPIPIEGERLTALTGKERGFEYPGSWPRAYLNSTSRSGFFENG